MERIEYRDIVDKSDWPRGPWDSEPDKLQWRDETTGLPCLIVRGPVGALCGYVGVLPGHAFHGLDYGQCPKGSECPDRTEERSWCDHTPESGLDVHGGITFAHGCSAHGRAEWTRWRARKSEMEREAARYPRGDAAQSLRAWAGCWDDFDKWAARSQARSICHLPAPGEPDSVWWFGFDCAHAGDFNPSYGKDLGHATGWGTYIEYRDLDYVTAECRKLAKQLHERAA